MLYCVEIYRELEEVMIEHVQYDHEPTRQEILEYVDSLDCRYDDNYGKIKWYRIN